MMKAPSRRPRLFQQPAIDSSLLAGRSVITTAPTPPTLRIAVPHRQIHHTQLFSSLKTAHPAPIPQRSCCRRTKAVSGARPATATASTQRNGRIGPERTSTGSRRSIIQPDSRSISNVTFSDSLFATKHSNKEKHNEVVGTCCRR